ncbi:hypothetical protein GOBAR_AA09047 [Gossypium barbadense]|uniref:Uncharacterized protein n=1 Tax=Gossypium barbadense TaxID=3634 RepID=A0A2P5Y7P9_GOSBA|nr:hypothetical protein GOBAR_AA09047 [Gossypium barbadense]
MLTIGPIVVLGPGKAKCLHREPLCRSQLKNTALCLPSISKQNNGQLFQRNQTFPSLINGGCRNKKMKISTEILTVQATVGSGNVSTTSPILHNKQMGAILKTEKHFIIFICGFICVDEADNMLETAEQITDVVEDVAGKVEEIADQVGEQLPDGGKLRATLELVEDLAEGTAKNAHLAGDLIDKVST